MIKVNLEVIEEDNSISFDELELGDFFIWGDGLDNPSKSSLVAQKITGCQALLYLSNKVDVREFKAAEIVGKLDVTITARIKR